MKRILAITFIIGLFLVSAVDLQAHSRRSGMPWHGRRGIGVRVRVNVPLLGRHYGYSGYGNHYGRRIAREIRRNEKRIWKLEKKINRIERRGGSYERIRELEAEIHWLERRNDYLRRQLY